MKYLSLLVFILALVSLVGTIFLLIGSVAIPEQLWAINYTLIGAVAGVTIPRGNSA